ncbi:hypothetical protein SRHO_G00249930 [Serrasalmus rhombeus]
MQLLANSYEAFDTLKNKCDTCVVMEETTKRDMWIIRRQSNIGELGRGNLLSFSLNQGKLRNGRHRKRLIYGKFLITSNISIS